MDRSEAIGNIETALTNVLNSFHSLYDAINKQLQEKPIDWYRTGSLAFILAIRNARHHNHANRIRTLYTYHLQEAKNFQTMEQCVLIDFTSPEEEADTFDVYVSWEDIGELISMPKKISKITDDTSSEIMSYLNSEKFPEYTRMYNLKEGKVFLNIVPLIVNAAIAIVPLIKDYCNSNTTESNTFKELFSNIKPADTINHDVNCGPFVLP
ncbi:hypothetical protein [Polaribacter sp. HaHaR_3_91]|uniref:hypothetical protein n=1 Tax=Polaribacter sp. HaHaR_3_91 TaxID=2745561 RepID=UPI001C4FE07A|nr:hypothetical protein [Polaribacter sp. HaHaR_3_91]QXP62488.1 hypothetical protein H0I27_11375 [Polaribacter sp. HaHaR_3_91]